MRLREAVATEAELHELVARQAEEKAGYHSKEQGQRVPLTVAPGTAVVVSTALQPPDIRSSLDGAESMQEFSEDQKAKIQAWTTALLDSRAHIAPTLPQQVVAPTPAPAPHAIPAATEARHQGG